MRRFVLEAPLYRQKCQEEAGYGELSRYLAPGSEAKLPFSKYLGGFHMALFHGLGLKYLYT